MSAQPEALRLADELARNQLYGLQRRCCDEAAAELRRLQAENHAQRALLKQAVGALETDSWQKKLQAAIDINRHLGDQP